MLVIPAELGVTPRGAQGQLLVVLDQGLPGLVVAATEGQIITGRVSDDPKLGVKHPLGAAHDPDPHLQPTVGHKPGQHGQAVPLQSLSWGLESLEQLLDEGGLVSRGQQSIQVSRVQLLVDQEPRRRPG